MRKNEVKRQQRDWMSEKLDDLEKVDENEDERQRLDDF